MKLNMIAHLCKKRPSTIKKWVHKIASDPDQNWPGLVEKPEEAEKSGKVPSFTNEETFATIGSGGNNWLLAVLLKENNLNKDAVTAWEDAAKALPEQVALASAAVERAERLNKMLTERLALAEVAIALAKTDASVQISLCLAFSFVLEENLWLKGDARRTMEDEASE